MGRWDRGEVPLDRGRSPVDATKDETIPPLRHVLLD